MINFKEFVIHWVVFSLRTLFTSSSFIVSNATVYNDIVLQCNLKESNKGITLVMKNNTWATYTTQTDI